MIGCRPVTRKYSGVATIPESELLPESSTRNENVQPYAAMASNDVALFCQSIH